MTDPVVLLVDDDPLNLDILFEALEGQGFALEMAMDGQQAWEKLLANPHRYSTIVLDRMMPRLDGLALLKILKGNPALRDIPVILQTAAAQPHQVLEGLQAGAYYYLTKPYDFRVCLSVVQAALRDFTRQKSLRQELAAVGATAAFLHSAHFRIRTHEEARQLALALSHGFDEPNRVIHGLEALLYNAIEHGNLGIGYDLKADLLARGQLENELANRQLQPENRAKWVDVRFLRENQWVMVEIEDQGAGFDWQPYLEWSPGHARQLNGRGIVRAREKAFDELEYQANGSRVIARCHSYRN